MLLFVVVVVEMLVGGPVVGGSMVAGFEWLIVNRTIKGPNCPAE